MLGGAAPSVAVGSRVFMTAQAMSDEGLQGTDLGEALLANWTCSCGCNSAEMLLAFCINQVKCGFIACSARWSVGLISLEVAAFCTVHIAVKSASFV